MILNFRRNIHVYKSESHILSVEFFFSHRKNQVLLLLPWLFDINLYI
jgi:hypothetical protein